MDAKEVAVGYLRSWFAIDLLSALPFEAIADTFMQSSPGCGSRLPRVSAESCFPLRVTLGRAASARCGCSGSPSAVSVGNHSCPERRLPRVCALRRQGVEALQAVEDAQARADHEEA